MENSKEEVKETKEEAKKQVNVNLWMFATIALALILIVVVAVPKITGGTGGITGKAISTQEAGSTVIQLINSYFVSQGNATLSDVGEESGLYKVNLFYNQNKIAVYITKDGKSLILPNGIVDIEQLKASATNTQQQQAAQTTVPKSDKPTVELYVMGFCPYGVKAENNIMPILTLLKDKIDFKIKFIVTVNGDKIEDVDSLHGIEEAKEDARQVVIMKYYPDKFYDYLTDINANCYSVSRDAAKLDECWKNAAKKLGMDVKKIETAAYGAEGINLLKQDQADDQKYGVSGSPTLIINGVKSDAIYQGTATTQQAICAAFNTAPSECSQQVQGSTTGDQPTGSCS